MRRSYVSKNVRGYVAGIAWLPAVSRVDGGLAGDRALTVVARRDTMAQ
jgi:hypothetical protein